MWFLTFLGSKSGTKVNHEVLGKDRVLSDPRKFIFLYSLIGSADIHWVSFWNQAQCRALWPEIWIRQDLCPQGTQCLAENAYPEADNEVPCGQCCGNGEEGTGTYPGHVPEGPLEIWAGSLKKWTVCSFPMPAGINYKHLVAYKQLCSLTILKARSLKSVLWD